MTIQEALEKLQGYEKATFALQHAAGLMYYDGATTAPKGTAELRGRTLGELSRMGYGIPCGAGPRHPPESGGAVA